jgi:DNA polymerase-3 subunit epsilon
MREVVLDTETTGLDPAADHRIVEIGCVELINHVPTERAFQCYVNPERDMPEEAFNVHGLSTEFLAGHGVFADIADEFLGFIEDSPLVIHNAEFDLKFLNAEFGRLGHPNIPRERAVDTVSLARRKFPGAQANLDALCRRFQIDLSDRSLHGALKDARLLAQVYLELIGGRQPDLALAKEAKKLQAAVTERPVRPPRRHGPSPDEEAAHAAFLAKLTEPVWRA